MHPIKEAVVEEEVKDDGGEAKAGNTETPLLKSTMEKISRTQLNGDVPEQEKGEVQCEPAGLSQH